MHPTKRYPVGTVRALLASGLVSPATRAALQDRLARPTVEVPRFFSAAEFATLRAVCARLVPQDGLPAAIDVAGHVDGRLADGDGDGWRYACMPGDGEAYRAGLAALDATALRTCGQAFGRLAADAQDSLLARVQRGEVEAIDWPISPRRFFEDLLAEATERFYSHPFVQEEIGFVGMADACGWRAIGLDRLDAHEPRPIVEPDEELP